MQQGVVATEIGVEADEQAGGGGRVATGLGGEAAQLARQCHVEGNVEPDQMVDLRPRPGMRPAEQGVEDDHRAEAAPRLARREVRPSTPANRSQTLSGDGVLRLAARPFPVPLVGRSLNRARRGGRHPASP